MIQDEVDTTLLSHKRRRSPAPSPQPGDMDESGGMGSSSMVDDTEAMQRPPKRLRRSHDIPAYDAPVHAHGLAHSNPLNRRMLKKAAKRARRAERPRGLAGGMEVDDDIHLDNTFLAGAQTGLSN